MNAHREDRKLKIAVVGGGIAGLTVAHELSSQFAVTLFESSNRIGGNAVTWESPDGDLIDISVFAFSKKSYPCFMSLIDRLGIETTRISIRGMTATAFDLETETSHVFGPFRLASVLPTNIRENCQMFRGVRKGLQMLENGSLSDQSFGQILDSIPELQGDIKLHLCFMLCLMSSMSYEEVVAAPAAFFFRKISNHLMRGSTVWRQVKGGTASYMSALATPIQDRTLLNTPVKSVSRCSRHIELRTAMNEVLHFDKVVFACGADHALNCIESPNSHERNLLGKWRYKKGEVVVHSDQTHFPPARLQSLYTYLYSRAPQSLEVSINACYNRQAGVSSSCRYIGTQHPNFPIDDKSVAFSKMFRTPIFDLSSTGTIPQLAELNEGSQFFFCGIYFGEGLHECAVRSAMEVSKRIRNTVPESDRSTILR